MRIAIFLIRIRKISVYSTNRKLVISRRHSKPANLANEMAILKMSTIALLENKMKKIK